MEVVALATCAELPEGDEDSAALVAALARRGVRGVPAVWDDPRVDWGSFTLVIVRSTWDYAERRDTFLAWAETLPAVLNPAPSLRLGTDKRYLAHLHRVGVPVVPTGYVDPGQRFEAPSGPFVIKPAVSAGGRASARFDAGEAERAAGLIARIHAGGRTAMVQPYLGEVEEAALVYLGGRFSHALRRRVGLPHAREVEGLYLPEELRAGKASQSEKAVAERALRAVGDPLLYARVDIAAGAVLELELVEPSLYLSFSRAAADRFADLIAREAVGRAGRPRDDTVRTSQ